MEENVLMAVVSLYFLGEDGDALNLVFWKLLLLPFL